jgi:hypothetical protein
MPKFDAESFVQGLQDHIKAILAPLAARVKALEATNQGSLPSAEEVAKALEGRFDSWALDFEKRAQDRFDRAIERMPAAKDGRDALQVEDFDLLLADDGRTLTVSLKAGDRVVEKTVRVPAVLDRGVFSPEKAYEKGDGVTYGGSFYITQVDDPRGVPGGSPDFRLAIKKGRDGKDLRDNASKRNPSDPVNLK